MNIRYDNYKIQPLCLFILVILIVFYSASTSQAQQNVTPTTLNVPLPSERALKPYFKGVELYSYVDDNGNIKYTLLEGTNRNKFIDEILQNSIDYDMLIKKIKKLAPGEHIVWLNSIGNYDEQHITFKLPDKNMIENIKSICQEIDITLVLLTGSARENLNR